MKGMIGRVIEAEFGLREEREVEEMMCSHKRNRREEEKELWPPVFHADWAKP